MKSKVKLPRVKHTLVLWRPAAVYDLLYATKDITDELEGRLKDFPQWQCLEFRTGKEALNAWILLGRKSKLEYRDRFDNTIYSWKNE